MTRNLNELAVIPRTEFVEAGIKDIDTNVDGLV